MVFQDYALYPHMTVRDNLGFALKMMQAAEGRDQQARREGRRPALLTALLDRRPKNLSGGQRQRVAMGRAIVREPQAFLMDEPLSNLDAKLRVQMRAEIAALQHQLGVTTLYVTHDQVEAMTMGDRVAVMKNGRLQQCARTAGAVRQAGQRVRRRLHRQPEDEPVPLDPDPGRRRRREAAFGPKALAISAETVARWPGLGAPARRADHRWPASRVRSSTPRTPTPTSRWTCTAGVVEMLGNETLVYFVAPVERASDADVRDRAQASDEEEWILAGGGGP